MKSFIFVVLLAAPLVGISGTICIGPCGAPPVIQPPCSENCVEPERQILDLSEYAEVSASGVGTLNLRVNGRVFLASTIFDELSEISLTSEIALYLEPEHYPDEFTVPELELWGIEPALLVQDLDAVFLTINSSNVLIRSYSGIEELVVDASEEIVLVNIPVSTVPISSIWILFAIMSLTALQVGKSKNLTKRSTLTHYSALLQCADIFTSPKRAVMGRLAQR